MASVGLTGTAQDAAPLTTRSSFGAPVLLNDLSRGYGGSPVVSRLSLEIAAGEFVTLLGPSGSGKTTALMMIAGLVEPDAGQIVVANRDITHTPPQSRNIGVVFQHYALFPHMTVAENVGYPLRMRKTPGSETVQRVSQALDLVHLRSLSARYPSQLSGGQQQRVAIARALVFEPPLLLLDEPLGALDKNLRESMQIELRGLKERLGLTVIHVTHDQTEALALSDRIAIMHDGRIEQVGTPLELYERPTTAFIAGFLGDSTRLDGRVEHLRQDRVAVRLDSGLLVEGKSRPGIAAGAHVTVMLRPERVQFSVERLAPSDLEAIVADVIYAGDHLRYQFRLLLGDLVTAVTPNTGQTEENLVRGQTVQLRWKADDVHVFAKAVEASRQTTDRPPAP
jgi:putative spermidine/putrescine transport system ATP-binding protein